MADNRPASGTRYDVNDEDEFYHPAPTAVTQDEIRNSYSSPRPGERVGDRAVTPTNRRKSSSLLPAGSASDRSGTPTNRRDYSSPLTTRKTGEPSTTPTNTRDYSSPKSAGSAGDPSVTPTNRRKSSPLLTAGSAGDPSVTPTNRRKSSPLLTAGSAGDPSVTPTNRRKSSPLLTAGSAGDPSVTPTNRRKSSPLLTAGSAGDWSATLTNRRNYSSPQITRKADERDVASANRRPDSKQYHEGPSPNTVEELKSRRSSRQSIENKTIDRNKASNRDRFGRSPSRKSLSYTEDSVRQRKAEMPGAPSTNDKDRGKTTSPVKSPRPSTVTDRKSPSGDDLGDYNMADDWQDGKTLTECNAYMLAYDLCTDLTCLVGDQEEPVSAHSYMLMSRSAHFYRILKQERKHAEKIISVPGVTPEIFRKLLQYIYTDQLDLDVPLAASMLPAADKYGTPTLKSKCFEYMLSELSSDNVVTILEQAHKYREHAIYDKCLHFIFVNAVDCLKTPNFKDLCRECLEKVAGADELNADEVTVYDALMLWAQGECVRRKLQPNDKNRRIALEKLLFCVRFPIIDVRIFTQKLSHREVLNQDEKILLYQHFHGQTDKLPDHYIKRPRKQYVVNPDVIAANQPNQKPLISSGSNGADDAYDFGFMPNSEPKPNPKHYDPMFIDSRQPVYRVVRFKGITGSWQINGADAISFKCSQTVILRGVQVFSPQKMASSSYTVHLAVFDDMRNEVRNEAVHIIPDKSKVQDVRLSDPVRVPVGRVFTVHTVIKGGPTIRGMDGVKTVSSEGVTFEFINSNKSLNGTDVTMGQIPSILFSIP